MLRWGEKELVGGLSHFKAEMKEIQQPTGRASRSNTKKHTKKRKTDHPETWGNGNGGQGTVPYG